MKEEPAAAGRGGSPEMYPTIYLRVQGGGGGRWRWWGSGVGIAGEKAQHKGGLEGWPGRWRTGGGECFRGGQGGAPPVAGGCLVGGGWRLRGVEVEDELQALDFVSNGCKID